MDFIKTSLWVRDVYKEMADSKGLTLKESIDYGLQLFLDYEVTVYFIQHLDNHMYWVDYYRGVDVQDLNFHHANTFGTGTVGDAIRREGRSCFRFEIVGRFDNMKHARNVMKCYDELLRVRGEKYVG